ncbi:MAG: non-heme iron oxygenase ferredoxin subunit [Actinomycetota bacterium]|nr:non-heme iron oxygenase ferredoxin subunit [Actinomycetota bacterium]
MSDVSIGMLADLPRDVGRRVDVGGASVAVFRVGEEVHAIADRCSHAEASLAEGELFDHEVECPKHGASFDVTTGKALTLPATKAVAVYAAEVRNGEVFIKIPEEKHADA